MKRLLLLACLLLPAAGIHGAQDETVQTPAPTVVTVRQSGEADFVGNDDTVIQAAMTRLKDGGTLLIGPGRYSMRRSIHVARNAVLRGEDGARLALPAPVLSAAAAAAGSTELLLADPGELVGKSRVQILPPVGSETFPDGATQSLELQQVELVEGARLVLREPLLVDVPAGSRVGYPHKMLQIHKDGLTTIENLIFEGGRVEAIPMPGHSQRCAIWSAAPFGYEEERLGPPGTGVQVRHCLFRDWYGRGVAFYNQVDGLVEGCVFERLADEAIDLDHFVERFRIVGNDVRDAPWGIVLNDASRNVVEYNRIEDCEIGIFCWWYERTPRQGINEENVVRHNVVRGARDKAIHFAQTCHRNTIEHNFVEGEVLIVEPTNRVAGNTELAGGERR